MLKLGRSCSYFEAEATGRSFLSRPVWGGFRRRPACWHVLAVARNEVNLSISSSSSRCMQQHQQLCNSSTSSSRFRLTLRLPRGSSNEQDLHTMVCSASLADAEGFHEEMESIQRGKTVKKVTESRGMDGMAEAFHITPGLAVGITAAIGLAALVLPIYMPSSAPVMPFKIRSLSYITLLFGFYMAWNIGANDVANAMGTSVGSGALSLRQAVLTAAVLEFSGAFMVGSHVSHTMQSGILTAGVFSGKDSLLFCGMLSSLGAAGTWLQVCITCSQKLCHVITWFSHIPHSYSFFPYALKATQQMLRLSPQTEGVELHAGSIIFWMACVNHTLHHRSIGWLWPCLWWNWCCVLEVFGTRCCIMGCVPSSWSSGFICGV